MDDYSVNSLNESKNEWCARLINTLTPAVIQGLKSIFNEAWKLCEENTQRDKYLMTFQTFLTRIPQWNPSIIETEKARICETSGCGYLEELITCVHIIHLKALTCVRVGQKQKKIDITIPSLDKFIHNIYINVARKIYTTIYLFEKNILPLETQKRNRELECIVKECILDTVRDSIPVENILRSYIDETTEEDVEVKEVIEETKIPIPEEEMIQDNTNDNLENNLATTKNELKENKNHDDDNIFETPKISDTSSSNITTESISNSESNSESNNGKLSFSDVDMMMDVNGNETNIEAPKTIERLEEISSNNKNNIYGDDEDSDTENKLNIGADISLDFTDVNDLNKPLKLNEPPILDDIEILT